jgi:hypothetical protein
MIDIQNIYCCESVDLSIALGGDGHLIKQLDGTLNQQVLLQASTGCAGLQIQFQSDGSETSTGNDLVYFDGRVVEVAEYV